ncbi:hypothetical protein C0995_014107 [Termitomyces sp. Mi166|nr:hypothetical protein C0995_014107 [Termitomyces sp. Mi166\
MSSPASRAQEEEQVEGHLRVCLHIDTESKTDSDPDFELTTDSPSEPLLSEVAARLTFRTSSPALLANVLYGFSDNRGDHGEFIGMQLILDARDAFVRKANDDDNMQEDVPNDGDNMQEDGPNDDDNMQEDGPNDNGKLQEDESDDNDDDLRGDESDDDDDLRVDEPDDNERVRHAKAQVSENIDWLSLQLEPPSLTFSVCDFLSNLFHLNLSRVLPSCSHPKHQGQTLGALLKHAKMNFNYFVKVDEFAAIENRYLPAAMAWSAALLCPNNQLGIDALTLFTYDDSSTIHPHNIGAILWQFTNTSRSTVTVDHSLFDIMDPIKLGILARGDPLIPVICIVLALGAKTEHSLRRPRAVSDPFKFTSFDFWCSGIKSDVLKPVQSQDEAVWQAILAASRPWEELYSSATQPAGRKTLSSQNPLAAMNEDFFSSFFDFEH